MGKGARHGGLGRGETVIEKEEAEESEDVSGFVAAEAFSGRKEGYSFKSGTLGLGYYRDVSANSQHPHPGTNQATGVTTHDKHVVSLSMRALQKSARRQVIQKSWARGSNLIKNKAGNGFKRLPNRSTP